MLPKMPGFTETEVQLGQYLTRQHCRENGKLMPGPDQPEGVAVKWLGPWVTTLAMGTDDGVPGFGVARAREYAVGSVKRALESKNLGEFVPRYERMIDRLAECYRKVVVSEADA